MQKDRFTWILAAATPIVIVFLFSESLATGADQSNFCLTLRYGFDVIAQRPHAPGYPLFALMWSIPYHLLSLSEHSSLLFTNGMFMIVALCVMKLVYEHLWGKKGSLAAVLLLASSPLFMYYGSIGEMYVFDAAYSLSVYLAFSKCSRRYILFTIFGYGLSGGFRTSSMILMAPLALLLVYERRRELSVTSFFLLQSLIVYLAGIAAWFIPLSFSVGGVGEYLRELDQIVNVESTWYQNLTTILSNIFWLIIPSVVFIFYRRKETLIGHRILIHFFAWVIPSLLFYFFRHYAKGYILLIAPVYILLLSRMISMRFRDRVDYVLAGVVSLNLLLFYLVPAYYPKAEAYLAKHHRSSSERIESALRRLSSTIAPTYAHVRTNEEAMKESLRSLSHIPKAGARILVDPSAEVWAYPRGLQVGAPEHWYSLYLRHSDAIPTMYKGEYYFPSYTLDSLFSNEVVYCFTDKDMKERYSSVLGIEPVAAGKSIALYSVAGEKRGVLRKLLADLYQSQ